MKAKKTFIEILNYLKVKYNWFPTKIKIDYRLSEKNAINYAFQICKIIPCFFHFVLNITKNMKANIISNNIIKDIIFYTKNIVESFNSVINKKFIGFCKTMNNYKQSLFGFINLYEMIEKYSEKNYLLHEHLNIILN